MTVCTGRSAAACTVAITARATRSCSASWTNITDLYWTGSPRVVESWPAKKASTSSW